MAGDGTQRGRKAWHGYPADVAARLNDVYKADFLAQQQKRAFLEALRLAGVAPSDGHRPRVVDVGCGTGEIAIALHDDGYDVTGIDTSAAMLKQFADNVGDRPIPVSHADLFEWKPGDQLFDAATARWVFAFYPDFRLPLQTVAGFVKPGGVIVYESCAREAVANVAALFDVDCDRLLEKVFVDTLPLETGEEIAAFCEQNGMRLEQRQPSTFWHQNPLLLLPFDDRETYKREIDQHVAKPDVQDFIRWFDERIGRTLGSRVTGSVINVVRKL